jgi:hypothetical protein
MELAHKMAGLQLGQGDNTLLRGQGFVHALKQHFYVFGRRGVEVVNLCDFRKPLLKLRQLRC